LFVLAQFSGANQTPLKNYHYPAGLPITNTEVEKPPVKTCTG